MFKRAQTLTFRRFNSHGHGLGTSKFINEAAFGPSKVNKAAGDAFKKTYEEKVHHSADITKLWKKITYIVALPAILLTAVPVINTELKHAEHREHLKHLSDEEWPVQYEYQNIRTHKYFWGDGDKTLFWNSDVNRHIES
ncbi:cytochrome c oxidase subunit VIa [Scheffersomyces xylosifermentans]|uniref:cytochrome c oxidase subunit VIa n=1 Tax=Scheffersomyces xylosifermentans TaxID=1304137 RepID=UPI00315DF8C0